MFVLFLALFLSVAFAMTADVSEANLLQAIADKDNTATCLLAKAALAAAAVSRNDTCFSVDTSCEKCAIDNHCAYCPEPYVHLFGKSAGVDFTTICDASKWCWQGNLFTFESPISSLKIGDSTFNVQVSCHGLPNWRQCEVSGNEFVGLTFGGALLLCCCFMATVCCCCCMRRKSGRTGYARV
eukprot:TRINITY_DN3316_c0_g2_i4.p2 TRINITY_DN3316_c0_g2~~TRINITY_DN3316_c0_g2_i4.p2  ORF type:complete len:198 (-),score=31.91 TRINITY_DN3316_c0_g2_i4:39-587(-)